MKAQLFDRQLFVDDRGHFTNIPLILSEFNFKGKRVYICDNFQRGTVRGYHYHEKEAKVFICLQGAVKFVLLPEDMMRTCNPLGGWKPETFVLSANINKALYIPANYANAWQSLTDDTILLGVSDRTVEESQDDDIRLDPIMYHPEYWKIEWR